MYYITGQVVKLDKDFALIDANGIGYQLRLTKRLAKGLTLGKEKIIVFQVNHHGKEPVNYAFASPKERCVFAALINKSALPPEDAFRLVSEAGEMIASMISNNDFKGLTSYGLEEEQAILITSLLKYDSFDIGQEDVLEPPAPRKIVPIRPRPKDDTDDEDDDDVKSILFDADGNSIIEQAVQAILQLRDNLKHDQAELLVVKAAKDLDATPETPVQEIILHANKMARNLT